MKVLIAGGGTGGHILPAIAIAHELQAEYNAEIKFIGAERGMEKKIIPQAGYDLTLLKIGALKNVSLVSRVNTLFDLPRAVLDSSRLIKDFKPDVVIGVGGYASGPAMFAAILRRVPTVAFESNFVPGLANRLIAPFVDAAAVQFAETGRFFKNVRVTGAPVRKEFFSATIHAATGQPTLLVTGGSQGSRAINRSVVEALPVLLQAIPGLHIIHQTGEREYESVREAYEKAGVKAELSAFISDMPSAFAYADVLLCRSGASTIAEITAAGKVAVFIPFPMAADDHQRRNAEALVSRGAAMLIPENELTSELLVSELTALLKDQARLDQMSAVSKSLSHPDAAREVARMAAQAAGITMESGH